MLTPEQQAIRRTGIGGSEIAAVVGESRFASPFDVWIAKTQGWQQEETEDMRRGTYLESGIADWYAARHGLEGKLDEHGTIRHAKIPIAICTPDRIVGGVTRRLVSIKAPRRGGYDWGKDGSGEVAPGYLLQLQWEHAVCSSHGALSDTMHLAALVDGDLRVYVVKADTEMQSWLLGYACEWWERHVVGLEAPPIEGSTQAGAWLRARFPRNEQPVRPATPWEDLRMLALAWAEKETERWSGESETLVNELKQTIGDAAGIESPAGVVTWKTDKNGKRSFRTKWTKGATHE